MGRAHGSIGFLGRQLMAACGRRLGYIFTGIASDDAPERRKPGGRGGGPASFTPRAEASIQVQR